MKNYSAILLLLLFISACSTSKQFYKENALIFTFPKNAQKISVEEFNQKYYRTRSSEMPYTLKDIYKVDSFIVGMAPIYTRPMASDELVRLLKTSKTLRFGEHDYGLKNYESNIRKYGKNEVLTEYLSTDRNNASYFSFIVINPARTQLLSGALAFPKSDKANAIVFLDKFLSSIRFKQ